MKRMDRRKQGMLRKPAIGMLAAVTAFTGMPLSAGIQAKASGSDELTARIQAIAQTQTKVDAAREKLIAEYSSGKHTVPEKPAAFKALFVKCSDVTMENTEIVDGKETTVKTRYTIGRDSDANTVIDHAIDRFEETVDANAPAFLAPESMKAAFDAALAMQPQTVGDYFRCAYRSLALSYMNAIQELQHNTGKHYDSIYIVGGGAKNAFLNRLTEETTGKKVIALPIEATAIGNLKIQMEVKS